MKLVTWKDENGKMYQSYVRDNDPVSLGPMGVEHNPPDLSLIDWDQALIELHNLLIERGLITWKDVQAKQNAVSSAITTVLKRKIISLYRMQDRGEL